MIQLASWKLPTLSDSNITRELTSTTSVLGCSKMNFIAWKKHGCFIPSHLLPFLYIGYIKTVDATYSSRKPPSSVDSLAMGKTHPQLFGPKGLGGQPLLKQFFQGYLPRSLPRKIRKSVISRLKKNGQMIFFKEASVSYKDPFKFWTICFLTASYLTDVSKMCGRYW